MIRSVCECVSVKARERARNNCEGLGERTQNKREQEAMAERVGERTQNKGKSQSPRDKHKKERARAES